MHAELFVDSFQRETRALIGNAGAGRDRVHRVAIGEADRNARFGRREAEHRAHARFVGVGGPGIEVGDIERGGGAGAMTQGHGGGLDNDRVGAARGTSHQHRATARLVVGKRAVQQRVQATRFAGPCRGHALLHEFEDMAVLQDGLRRGVAEHKLAGAVDHHHATGQALERIATDLAARVLLQPTRRPTVATSGMGHGRHATPRIRDRRQRARGLVEFRTRTRRCLMSIHPFLLARAGVCWVNARVTARRRRSLVRRGTG
ncbi:MAG: hypothetical protein IPG43_23865 [Proteobacteria bacterium]|nr:hypothetical protein [Pseudomonadota bacterium]